MGKKRLLQLMVRAIKLISQSVSGWSVGQSVSQSVSHQSVSQLVTSQSVGQSFN